MGANAGRTFLRPFPSLYNQITGSPGSQDPTLWGLSLSGNPVRFSTTPSWQSSRFCSLGEHRKGCMPLPYCAATPPVRSPSATCRISGKNNIHGFAHFRSSIATHMVVLWRSSAQAWGALAKRMSYSIAISPLCSTLGSSLDATVLALSAHPVIHHADQAGFWLTFDGASTALSPGVTRRTWDFRIQSVTPPTTRPCRRIMAWRATTLTR